MPDSMPPQMERMMQQAMSQAFGQMKEMRPQIVWDCLEFKNPAELPALMAKQGRVVAPQVFLWEEKLYIFFGRM